MGSGHGWVGVTQVVWNCTVKRAAVQSPWANGKNYCIGLKGEKDAGHFKDRPDGEWEGQNKDGLQPPITLHGSVECKKEIRILVYNYKRKKQIKNSPQSCKAHYLK